MNDRFRLRRAVITGLGVMAPNGKCLKTFWNSFREPKSAGKILSRFDTRDMPTHVAAEIIGFDPGDFLSAKKILRMDLANQYSVAAAKMAIQDSGLDTFKVNRRRMGVVEGSSLGGFEGIVRGHGEISEAGYRGVGLFSLMNGYCGSGSGEVAQEIGARGHAVTFCSGSASGNDSIGYALKMIQTAEVDIMIAGGSEAPFFRDVWAVFCKSSVMTKNTDPEHAMRPFDQTRDGFLLGEGAAFLILEELTHALDRGAKIHAEVLGHGRSCEAYHSISPHPKGLGVSEAIEKAMESASLEKSQVQYINAHGTATPINDLAETAGIKAYFGDQVEQIAISSTKPITGHLLGASGALEAVICTLAIQKQEIPPTLNLDLPAPGCDLDYVPNHMRTCPVKIVLSLNSGFGGKNSCLILGQFSEKKEAA